MEEVVRAIEGIGGGGVRTYLQSGNAVFCGGSVEGVVELLGLPVVFVEWEECERMVAECPFEESERLHLMVLREAGGGSDGGGKERRGPVCGAGAGDLFRTGERRGADEVYEYLCGPREGDCFDDEKLAHGEGDSGAGLIA